MKVKNPVSSALIWALIGLSVLAGCKQNTETSSTSSEESTSEVKAASDSKETISEGNQTKTLVFFGNSLTAGYGIETREAYPALIQQKLDSLGGGWTVVNAGLSGDTTAGGLSRLEWVLSEGVDVFVLELGGNDGLRGIPLEETRKNLQSIIDKVKKAHPDAEIVLAGMQIPPNLGPEYTTGFKELYPELAEANNIALIPFLLEGVAGNPDLNLPDGIHPTPDGHKIMAETVFGVIEKFLGT